VNIGIDARVAKAVSPELIESFRTNGAVIIKGIFTPAELATLRDGIDTNLTTPSPRAKVASRPDDPGWYSNFLMACDLYSLEPSL
jgi:hypothetical protein